MDESANTSANANSPDAAAVHHRSFRLTREVATSDMYRSAGSFHDAIVFALAIQLPVLLLSSLLLDGGLVFQRVAIAAVAFWGMTLCMMLRRCWRKFDSDILIVKWGYLPILFVTCIFWLVAMAIVSLID